VYEVVVVDDGSTDATPDLLRDFVAKRYRLQKIRQPNLGLNAARNTGARAARGELLAFLDDDVVVPPDYVDEVLQGFVTHPDASALAGQITLRFEGPVPRWLTAGLEDYLSAFDAAARADYLSPPDYPRGANFALRRTTWLELGAFLPGLDRQGSALVSNGEREFFERLHASGGRIAAWPAAAVVHRVPPERLTLAWFCRRAQAQGASNAMLESHNHHRFSGIWREGWRAGRAGPILIKSVLSGRGLASALIWLSLCFGRAQALYRARQ
jgi:glycosyltransferase involved in cell wall biosynthesis